MGQRSDGQVRQRSGEEGRSRDDRDVVDLVAPDRLAQRRDRHLLRAGLRRVQRDDADRLRAQLVNRPRPRVALEEADGDDRRDDPGEDHADEEDRREPKAQGAEHGPNVLLDQAAGVSRAGAGLTL